MPLHCLFRHTELNVGDLDGLVLVYGSGESRRLALMEITKQKPPGYVGATESVCINSAFQLLRSLAPCSCEQIRGGLELLVAHTRAGGFTYFNTHPLRELIQHD